MAILIQYANGVPGVKFILDKTEITIGRALDNDISIDDEFVSKYHAVIQLVENELTSQTDCILIDNNSTNHTYINNDVVSAHLLDEKDKIYIGQNEFRFSAESFSAVELGCTHNEFYDDDAPGLMNANLSNYSLTTNRLDDSEISFSNLSVDNAYPTGETAAMKQQSDFGLKSTDSLDQKQDAEQMTLEDNKRFSRRLSLINA